MNVSARDRPQAAFAGNRGVLGHPHGATTRQRCFVRIS